MTRTFLRHYVEMPDRDVPTGMGGFAAALAAAGVEVEDIGLRLLWMAFTMTVGMVAWLRERGSRLGSVRRDDRRDARRELRGDRAAVDRPRRRRGTLLAIQHAGMFPAMLVAMLLRRDEYSGHARSRG